MSTVDSGDNAFVLVCACLVMFMTPGVGFFYGGMVNKKNLLSTIAYCMMVFSVVSIVWALLGFSLAFGDPTSANGFIGDCKYCGLRNLFDPTPDGNYSTTIPISTYFIFQTMFAAITPAIFVGSIVGKIRLSFLLVFTSCWVIIVYCPIAYWSWNWNGWLFKIGTIDFAGGNVIHIPSGMAGLASALYLGNKKAQKQNSASISLTLIGVAILWIGWFGFNGGSALSAGINATSAILNSHIAACSAGLAWAGIQYLLNDKPSILGFACGSICGLVSITPGAGYVAFWASIPIGALGGLFSYLFCHFKAKYFEDLSDTLDVFGCHGISGIWGGIATGLFATCQVNTSACKEGLFYGGGRQFGVNILGITVSAAYSFAITLVLYFLLGKIMEVRVSEEVEHEGLDFAIHGEENDPITQKEVIEIIKSVNNFNSVGNLITGSLNKINSQKQVAVPNELQGSMKHLYMPMGNAPEK